MWRRRELSAGNHGDPFTVKGQTDDYEELQARYNTCLRGAVEVLRLHDVGRLSSLTLIGHSQAAWGVCHSLSGVIIKLALCIASK